jgi:predicted phosphodiesterase
MMKKLMSLSLTALLIFILIGCGKETTTLTTVSESTTWSSTAIPFDLTIAEKVALLANPFNIGLFLTEESSTSVAINFELSEDEAGYIDYRLDGSEAYQTVEATKKPTMVGKKTVYLNEAVITNLLPGTTYEYRVRNASMTLMSDAHRFKTAESDPDGFSFMVLADPQETSEVGYMAFANGVYNVFDQVDEKPDFMMFVGDVVNDADVRSQWNFLFKYASMFLYDTPIVATAGNHDIAGISGTRMTDIEFDGYFNLPNNGPEYTAFDEIENDVRPADFDDGKTYSFDYDNTHFVSINTETLCDGTTSCAAMDVTNVDLLKTWLIDDLASNTQTWTIVFMHRGTYSLSYDTARVREQLVPIFEANDVDLVLSGHDHQYSRSIYKAASMIEFKRSDIYSRGTISLIENSVHDFNFNDYSTSLGVTYLVGNTSGTKYYGGDRSSGIDVQYRFLDENPVIPHITITDDYIKIVSYGMLKSSAIQIAVDEVYVLETVYLRK